jgi:hypothetical protein
MSNLRIARYVVATAPNVEAFYAKGQDLETRAYASTPVGLNFLIMGYSHL